MDDEDLAAALALSQAKDQGVGERVAAFLALPKSGRDESLKIVLKLLKNLVKEPENAKFRSVKFTNPKIRAAIVDVPEAKGLLCACGFEEKDEGLVAGDEAEVKSREAVALLETATADYVLSTEFSGHAGAVRCVCALPDGQVATGAMDNVVRVFPADGGFARNFIGHARTAGVDGVLTVRALSSEILVSGARDGKILLWNLMTGSQSGELTGHGDGSDVTNAKSIGALAALPDGTVVSGGWDKTVRIWSTPPTVLVGHEVAVNGVCVLSTGDVVSASGDGTLRLWRGGACTQVCKGGSPVRAVCAVEASTVAFASGHNDGRIRTWASGGIASGSASGGNSYLFSVSYAPSIELLASGGDDGQVKLWSLSLELVQTIQHPMEVFSVCFSSSGDLLTACADETARLWTRDSRRAASEQVIQAFDAKIAAVAVAAAHATASPVAAGAPQGGPWDFEFPVELTGGKKMTLRWRRGESAQDVANRFLQENGLPANHMPDVMAFVTQTMSQQGGVGTGAGAAAGGPTISHPVEVADGRRLTITWTQGEDPMTVARRFAAQHMIGMDELPVIANFVAQVQGSAAPAAAPMGAPSAPISAEMVSMIVAMGFDEASARAALQASRGNVEMAIARLCG
mmetsp:Transcript_7416/g.17557  ORF Transcript_7416/g.17557 Transcript_7416/m.17557 type:complete len:629 (+) Transcript_7416:43-1929(+)